jgi:hypothetical protein
MVVVREQGPPAIPYLCYQKSRLSLLFPPTPIIITHCVPNSLPVIARATSWQSSMRKRHHWYPRQVLPLVIVIQSSARLAERRLRPHREKVLVLFDTRETLQGQGDTSHFWTLASVFRPWSHWVLTLQHSSWEVCTASREWLRHCGDRTVALETALERCPLAWSWWCPRHTHWHHLKNITARCYLEVCYISHVDVDAICVMHSMPSEETLQRTWNWY